jgi:hypothetical protein
MILPESGTPTVKSCLRSFEPYLLLNPTIGKPMLHLSLNPDPKERVDNTTLARIADDYMGQMGYGEQPYIVYLHEDTGRKHIHIISVRIKEDGKLINDSFIHRRSMRVCTELEHKYGLHTLAERKHKGKAKVEKPELRIMRAAVTAAIKGSRSRAEFEEELRKRGLAVTIFTNASGRIYGITFRDENTGTTVKGSSLGKPFSANAFNEWFNNGIKPYIGEAYISTEVVQNHHTESVHNALSIPAIDLSGLFDITPTTTPHNDEYEEALFRKRTKTRKRRKLK